MLRATREAFDIRAICDECGIELCDLSILTGMSEEELLAFAAGVHAISAEDWLLIILVLFERSRALPYESRSDWKRLRTVAKVLYAELVNEAEEEKRAAERREM